MAPETESLDVLTIGEMVVDFISVEKTDTLSNASTFEWHLGGSPANVAKLGGRSAIITKLGSDYFGEYAEDQLQHHGVNTEAVSRTNEASTTNAFVTRTVSIPEFQVNRGADALHIAVRQVDEEFISRARIIHTSAFALSKDPQRLAVRRATRLGSRLDFAHEVASLKLRVEGHVERMIDRESLYSGLKYAGQRTQ